MAGNGRDGQRRLTGEPAELVRLAGAAMSEVMDGLTGSAAVAEGATAADKALAELRERIEEDAAGVLPGRTAQRSDRHTIVVGVHVGTEVECLADLAEQLLRLAWSRQSAEPWPERLRLPLRGMGEVVLVMLAKAADTLEAEAAEARADLLAEQHEVAQRQRLLYELLLSGAEPAGAGDSADATLLACYYQRCADHAVSVARHAVLFSAAGGR
ncbi:PhoU domain-containing protein [Kitasatospora sp. NPDC092286]|uniref:PhoU domain-containing protein n=1 Tax=Kitasatospora sp. NPDC092286 TaxID=3364087 RepID=UPI00380CC1CE